jgi:hypothetical protein
VVWGKELNGKRQEGPLPLLVIPPTVSQMVCKFCVLLQHSRLSRCTVRVLSCSRRLCFTAVLSILFLYILYSDVFLAFFPFITSTLFSRFCVVIVMVNFLEAAVTLLYQSVLKKFNIEQ